MIKANIQIVKKYYYCPNLHLKISQEYQYCYVTIYKLKAD